MRSTLCALACLFALASGPTPQAFAGNGPLRVGMAQSFFHDMTKPLIDSVTEPFVAIMKETAGLSGELAVGGDSFAVARQLDDNKLQLGVFHGFEFGWVQQKHPELRPLMIAVNSKQSLRAYVLVQKDGAAKTFADLKGKELVLPKRTKQHCRYFVERQCGGSPKGFFRRVEVGVSVESALDELAQGKLDAAVVDTVGLDFYKELNPGRFAKLRILAQSEVFPPLVIAYRPGSVKEETLTKIKDGLRAAHKTDTFRDMEKTWHITSIDPVPADFSQTLSASLKTFPMPQK